MLDVYQGDAAAHAIIFFNMGDDENPGVTCRAQDPGSDQLLYIRRWLGELEGQNRKDAFELLNLVMEGKISDEEAFTVLDMKHD